MPCPWIASTEARRRRRGHVGAALLIGVFLVSSSSAGGQTVTGLTLVSPAEPTLTVPLKADGDVLEGRLDLLVLNPGGTGGILTPSVEVQGSAASPSLLSEVAPTIGARDVARLRLRATVPSTTADDITGAIVVSLPDEAGIAPLAVPVIFDTPDETSPSMVEPKSVTVVYTRGCPVWCNPQPTVMVVGGTTEEIDARTARLASGGGSVTDVGLGKIEAQGADHSARLLVPDPPRAGEYKGSIPLSDMEDAEALTVTLKVRHWWGLMVLPIFAGLALGFAFGPLRDRRKAAGEQRARLKDSAKAYSDARRKYPVPGLYSLKKTFLDWPGEDEPTPLARAANTVPDLYLAFGNHGLKWLNETWQERIKQVDDAVARGARWRQIAPAAARLATATVGLWPTLGAAPPEGSAAGDTKRLFGDLAQEPGDDAEALRLTRRADDQARVLEAYRRAKDQIGEEGDLDAENVYRNAGSEPNRRPRETDDLISRLEDLRLFALEAARTVPTEGTRGIVLQARHQGAGNVDVLAEGLANPVWKLLRLRTVEEERRVLRRIDLWAFLLISAATLAAYIIPMYIGATWGTFADYISAFSAGVVGSAIALAWSRLPWTGTGKAVEVNK